jgi:hypothetical protein
VPDVHDGALVPMSGARSIGVGSRLLQRRGGEEPGGFYINRRSFPRLLPCCRLRAVTMLLYLYNS